MIVSVVLSGASIRYIFVPHFSKLLLYFSFLFAEGREKCVCVGTMFYLYCSGSVQSWCTVAHKSDLTFLWDAETLTQEGSLWRHWPTWDGAPFHLLRSTRLRYPPLHALDLFLYTGELFPMGLHPKPSRDSVWLPAFDPSIFPLHLPSFGRTILF